MRTLIQRSSQAKVEVDGKTVGKIDQGLVVLLGITHEDTKKDVDSLVTKIVNLRVFESEEGYFDKSLLDIKGDVLVISQFTLYSSTKKGRRPDFTASARPEIAEGLYDLFVKKMQETGLKTASGVFGAMMDVSLTNSGPATFIIES